MSNPYAFTQGSITIYDIEDAGAGSSTHLVPASDAIPRSPSTYINRLFWYQICCGIAVKGDRLL